MAKPSDYDPCLDSGCAGNHEPDERLAMAQMLCEARGVQLTPLRHKVLELLWRHHGPIGAYELMDRMKAESGHPVSPPTVYRSLEFLMRQGLVSKIESLNAYVPCSHPERPHDCLYFICESCGDSTERENPALVALLDAKAAEMGFRIARHTVEVAGTCARCAEAANR